MHRKRFSFTLNAMAEEVAPPFQSWSEHLKGLDNQQLAQLANDYRWLDEEVQAVEERDVFRKRREAIIDECERRGLPDLAEECKRPGT
jgi:hypothetical protein